jgi:hypothetical protein
MFHLETNLEIKNSRSNEGRKARGEVFTPSSVVHDLLSEAPSEYMTQTSRWLEPSAGAGNLIFPVMWALYHHLSSSIPEHYERLCHIIERQLFIVELDPDNCKVMRSFLAHLCPRAKPNIHCGDYLTLDTLRVWGIDRFDVVITNPPYSSKTKRKLWESFIHRILNLHLRLEGLLMAIIPPVWRRPGHPLHSLFNLEIRWLKMMSRKTCEKVFNICQRVDLLVLRNVPSRKLTTVLEDTGLERYLCLSSRAYLPHDSLELVESLTRGTEKVTLLRSDLSYHPLKDWVSEERQGAYQVPIVEHQNEGGPRLKWSSRQGKEVTQKKVIISLLHRPWAWYDKGEYGLGSFVVGLRVQDDEEGEAIVRALNSPTFRTVLEATKWSTTHLEKRFLQDLRADFWWILLDHDKYYPEDSD